MFGMSHRLGRGRDSRLARVPAALWILIAAAHLSGAQIARHPAPTGPLDARLVWARGEAGRSGPGKGYWAGYSIRRSMGEHSQFSSNLDFGSGGGATLEELIYGHRTPAEKWASTSGPAAPAAPDRGERQVVKEIAVLLKYDSPAAQRPRAIAVSNLTFPASLGGLPLYWLGPAEDGESIRVLEGFYGPADPEDFRASVVHAVALHRRPDLVVPFLERILGGSEAERIRADAAEFLGEQGDARALEILNRTVSAEKSLEVRKSAIEGLVEFPGRGGLPVIIQAAKSHPDREVRLAAIRALGEFRDPVARRALVEIIRNRN